MWFKVAENDARHKGLKGGKNAGRASVRRGACRATYGRDQRQCFGNNAPTPPPPPAITETVAAFDVIGESEAN